MLGAKEAVEQLHRWGAALGRPGVLPVQGPRMKAAATEIAARFADVVPRPPTPFDLDQLRKRLVDAVSAGSFDGITSRDWKRSPWVFWLGGPACLARDSRLQNRYEDFLQSRSGTGAIKTLIHA